MGRVPFPCAGPSRYNSQGSKMAVNRRRSCTRLQRRGTLRTRRRTRAAPPPAPATRVCTCAPTPHGGARRTGKQARREWGQRGGRGGTEAREPGEALGLVRHRQDALWTSVPACSARRSPPACGRETGSGSARIRWTQAPRTPQARPCLGLLPAPWTPGLGRGTRVPAAAESRRPPWR